MMSELLWGGTTMKHKFSYCPPCKSWTVLCGHCGNNTCNGGSGELKDGTKCPSCKEAHAIQDNPTKEQLLEIIEVLENYILNIKLPDGSFLRKESIKELVKTLEIKTISRKKAADIVIKKLKERL